MQLEHSRNRRPSRVEQSVRRSGPRTQVAPLLSGQGGTPLERDVRTMMEAGLGADFSSVRIHTGQTAQEAAESLHATAYTVGRDVAFARGSFAPGSAEGRELLAHELAHVAQNDGGPNPAVGSARPISVSEPTDATEREARDAARAVASGRTFRVTRSAGSQGAARCGGATHAGGPCAEDDEPPLLVQRQTLTLPRTAPPDVEPRTGQQHREENNALLAEIQGLPMYDLLPRLAKLAEKVLTDEEAGGLVGGPRLVLAMQTVRAKMQRDLEFLLREKKRVETLPRDQIADIVNFLWGPNVGTSTALVNTDLEMDPIIAPPASVRLPGEAARAGDGGIAVDDESGPQGVSDFEEELPENRSRISGVVLDPETKEIIGYRTSYADGISRLVDREGNFVVDAGAAVGVESEGLGPLDYVPTPSGVGKGAAGVGAKLLVKGALRKGAASGGKVTLGAILKMKNVAKAVAKKAISPVAEGKAFIQAIRFGKIRVSRTLSVEAAESLTKQFDKGRPVIAAEMNKRGIIGPFDSFSVFTRGHGGAYQAHHIVEQSVLKHLGHDVQKAPSIILTAGQHSPISTALANKIPKDELEHMTKREILDLYRKVYKGMPTWIAEVELYLK
ncbi:DUF4157 domain-containing protein [Streptomyces canus]|uniref:eCIS core domain-containing protein n=1 Tax=Streptomyces canus TaxID=58343 RepID=UPI0030E34EF7